MVSAPSGRICKKKKCTSRSYNDGDSDCHSLRSSAFIENASSVTLSISCRCTWPRCTPSVCPSSRPLTHIVFIACTSYFLRFLFSSFECCCGASPGESSWRQVWHSSLTRQCSKHDGKELRVWRCVIDRIKLLPTWRWKRPHVCAWTFFVMKELMTKHRNCVFYKWTLPTSFKELQHTYACTHTQFIQVEFQKERVSFLSVFKIKTKLRVHIHTYIHAHTHDMLEKIFLLWYTLNYKVTYNNYYYRELNNRWLIIMVKIMIKCYNHAMKDYLIIIYFISVEVILQVEIFLESIYVIRNLNIYISQTWTSYNILNFQN